MPTIHINPSDPASIDVALNTEWLLTNGLGGYAMGTALGVNTRRYHGLLVAATKPPVGRIVALHSMIEQLIIPREDGSEEVIDLSTQQFVGGDGQPMLHPNGWRWLAQANVGKYNNFRWTWQGPDFHISRSIRLSSGQLAILRYDTFSCPQSSRLRLRPITPMRDFHSLGFSPRLITKTSDRGIGLLDGQLLLRFHSGDPFRWSGDPQEWRQFTYVLDNNRGQDHVEDLWSPGAFDFEILPENPYSVTLRVELINLALNSDQPPDSTIASLPSDSGDEHAIKPAKQLVIAASQFVVSRTTATGWQTSVIAGYPWFGDWGRDTMIALPGLMLCTGRFDEARSTLLTFARSMKNGLLPNLFDDYGAAEHYNTVDASLWFVHAVRELWRATQFPPPLREGVRGWVGRSNQNKRTGSSGAPHPHPHPDPPPQGGGKADAELLRACREIIAAYRRGTDFKIRMNPRDGLIAAGDPSTQLTWMDAKRDGIAFTPRNGKPVEINALWFNALRCLAEMTDDPRERDDLISLSEKVAKSFREQFWWEERRCLQDVLSPSAPGSEGGSDATSRVGEFIGDRRLRPNQIFAVSLPFSPLTHDQQRAVVKIIGERLLTPFGLRTLDRDDPQYRGRYEGNLFDRDSAYHQGTVWPWLIGPYCEALLRINDFNDDARRQVRTVIQPLIDEMSNTSGGRCLNQIAEVYDGDPPQRPSGCPAQAWSVAEVLRIVTIIADEKSKRPKV